MSRSASIILCLLATTCAYAQVDRGQAPAKGPSTLELPSVKLTFSEPKLDSPLQLPSTIMDGAPLCGPEGRAFIQFLTPPPMYNYRVIYSVSSTGQIAQYPLDPIVGLTHKSIQSFDPGVSSAVMLLQAADINRSKEPLDYYIALFDYDGKFRSYAKLELEFQPTTIAQLDDNSFLVIGADNTEARPKFVLIASNGQVKRNLDAQTIMPSEQNLKTMLQSMNLKTEEIPSSMRTSAVLSLFRPVHAERALLILEPGAGAQVFELSSKGDMRMVKLDLPKDQIADSIIASKGRWFVRTYLRGTDDQSNIYEVDPKTGRGVSRLDSGGVPTTSFACLSDSGFYGLRWVERKPYLIFADFR